LHRVMTTQTYSRGRLEHTLSPSMDISISSNFERLLFDLHDGDGAQVKDLMERFNSEPIIFSDKVMAKARQLFDSQRVDDKETCQQIANTYAQTGYLLDPHSAIGVKAAHDRRCDTNIPMITLATAHPAKFPDAAIKAGQTDVPELPYHMRHLFELPERFEVIENDLDVVQNFMVDNLST